MSKYLLLQGISFLLIVGLLAGCMKGEQTTDNVNNANANDNVNLGENESQENDVNDTPSETEETVSRELYLIDEKGLVVPETFELPKSESAAKQVMEYLVKEGPVTELLPSGFEAILPAGTEILDVNLSEDGTLTVNVSEEFSEYDPKQELQVIQAMTHTLTQFDSVESIKLWINGKNQTEMPREQTPLSEGYSRADGINLDISDQPNLQHHTAVTMYYPKDYDEGMKYVPVTKYVQTSDKDQMYQSMVQSLLDGPSYDIMVKDVFNDNTQLTNKPSIKDGVLELEFSSAILKDEDKQMIADDTMETLVKTLTGQADIDAVHVKVENVEQLNNESNQPYNHPVSNQDFMTKEKM